MTPAIINQRQLQAALKDDMGMQVSTVRIHQWLKDGMPHPHGWLRKALARAARAAGVVGTLGNHRLRASFATRHAACGTSLDAIQAMMGHGDISTTRGYIEDDLGRQKAAQENLSVLLKKGS